MDRQKAEQVADIHLPDQLPTFFQDPVFLGQAVNEPFFAPYVPPGFFSGYLAPLDLFSLMRHAILGKVDAASMDHDPFICRVSPGYRTFQGHGNFLQAA